MPLRRADLDPSEPFGRGAIIFWLFSLVCLLPVVLKGFWLAPGVVIGFGVLCWGHSRSQDTRRSTFATSGAPHYGFAPCVAWSCAVATVARRSGCGLMDRINPPITGIKRRLAVDAEQPLDRVDRWDRSLWPFCLVLYHRLFPLGRRMAARRPVHRAWRIIDHP